MAWGAAFQGIQSLGSAYLGYRASKGGGTARPGLPALTASAAGLGLAAVGGAVVRTGIRGARSITNSAISYCRKHPAWCSTIGGIAAVEGLVGSGQLPIVKRRRARGISASELRSFRRVARFFRGYCPTVRRYGKSKSCR